MSTEDEIQKLRTDADLRFYASDDPISPQARYASTKALIWSTSLILCLPIGLLFDGIGIAIVLFLGILFVHLGLSTKKKLKALANEMVTNVQKEQAKQAEKEKIGLEYKKLIIEKMKKEAKNEK